MCSFTLFYWLDLVHQQMSFLQESKHCLFVTGLDETVGLVKGIGGKVYAFKCDLADREDVYRIAKKTQEEVGDVSCKKFIFFYLHYVFHFK